MRSPVLLQRSHAATARITRTGNACLVSSYVAGKRLEQTLAGHPRTAPSPFAPVGPPHLPLTAVVWCLKGWPSNGGDSTSSSSRGRCGGEKSRAHVVAKPAEMHGAACPRRFCEMPVRNSGRHLELAAQGSRRLRPSRRKTAQESSARGENRGHRGGTMRAGGAFHTSVSGA